jgi:hypothetical protein
MSTWPSLKARLLKNMCSKIKNQSRKSLLLTRKRNRDYNNHLLRLYKRCKQKTHQKFESKGKNTMEYKLGRITKD